MRAKLCSVVSVAAFTLFCCPLAFSQEGLPLFHKMQEALGGADKIASIRDFEQIVRADTWDDNGKPHGEVRKRTRWVNANFLRLDQVGPDDSYVLYFNGTSGWEILPDKSFAVLAGGELKFAQDYLRSLDVRLWLADRDAGNVITSSAPYVITLSDKAETSTKVEITLDPETLLPVKTASISMADSSHPVSNQTRLLEQWEAFGGVKFPQRISIFHGGRKLAAISVVQTRVNGGIKPDDLATKPVDLKPIMSQLRD